MTDNVWKKLEVGIDHIMTHLEQGLSYDKYMELYTGIYNHCTASGSHLNPSSTSGRGANLMGGYLYENLQLYLKDHLLSVKQAGQSLLDDSLLVYYSREWKRYSTASMYIHRVFRYLNRHWVKRELDEGHKNVYDVYTLCLVSWRDYFFMSVHGQVTSAMLNAIQRHRSGESVDSLLLRSISGSFTVLGLDELDISRRTLDIYKKYFEDAFISSTKVFYAAESEAFVASNSVVDYMRKCESRLAEEEQRVDLYLDPSTLSTLKVTCETCLIANHRASLVQEFATLLEQFKTDDLHRCFVLMGRIPQGHDPLKGRFEEHVKKIGLQSIDKLVSSSSEPDPKAYVDSLLRVYQTFFSLVVDYFDDDAGFMGSLDKACRDFVNRNALCKTSSSKSPEYLARYSDTLLKKGSKGTADDTDVDAAMDNIMAVFKYIEDKDVFQKFYSKMLAKRLVYDTSLTEEAEETMINKLKEACGFEYTSKLSRMFTDMSLSKDLNEGFRTRVDDEGSDFYIKVLATGSWPLMPPTSPFTLSPSLERLYTRFQSYYHSQHSGRKLTWLFHLSHGELKTNYLKTSGGAKANYILIAYTYTMGVLLAYNEAESYSGRKLLEIVGLNEESLKSQLALLLKAKLLKVAGSKDDSSGSGSSSVPSIDLDSEYSLNAGFKSKKIRVNLKTTIKSEQKVESDETHKTVEEDRKLLIQVGLLDATAHSYQQGSHQYQAAIVRIMKTRRVLKHVALIDEVITQLQSRFKPKIPDIKKCIDILVEKEYIERKMANKGAEYHYLA